MTPESKAKAGKKSKSLFEVSHDVKSFYDLPPMNSKSFDSAIKAFSKTLDEEGIPIRLSERTFFVSKEFADKPENCQSMANFHSQIMEYNGVKYYPQKL